MKYKKTALLLFISFILTLLNSCTDTLDISDDTPIIADLVIIETTSAVELPMFETDEKYFMEKELSKKEDEIINIFINNKNAFKKIEKIITENYPYFYIRYEGEDFQYNTINGGKDFETATDDVIEKDDIINFMQSLSINSIQRQTLGALGGDSLQINFYIKLNDAIQGIRYIYEPEDDNYYDKYNNRNLSILRCIEDNWFYYYIAPPD